MTIVVDASVTMAWIIETEATPYTEGVLDRLRDGGALVPAIWPLEVANAVLVAERRQRLTQAQTTRGLQLLGQLPLTVVDVTVAEAWGAILRLARDHGLSTYDASYLTLALREGLPLATQDARLRAAAVRLAVPLVEAEPHNGAS